MSPERTPKTIKTEAKKKALKAIDKAIADVQEKREAHLRTPAPDVMPKEFKKTIEAVTEPTNTTEVWTPENEEVLNTLLAEIESAKKELAEVAKLRKDLTERELQD